MNRRRFLQILSALGVATQLPHLPHLPELDETPVTPEFVKQFDGESFRIELPDGTSWRFNGRVVATSDDSVQIQPLGELQVDSPASIFEEAFDDDDDDEMDDHFAELLTEPSLLEEVGADAMPAHGVELWRDGSVVAEVVDIAPPALTHLDNGLLQHGSVTFTVQWKDARG